MLQAPPGTRDLFEPEIALWQKIEQTVRQVMALAAYREIRTPIFEPTELFARGIGEATDIVGKEMYTFTDRGDRSLTLRPEGTAGVSRAVIERKLLGGGGILRLWYMGPMFRYERAQKGRQRQFHQIGLEVLGCAAARADAEAIALAQQVLHQLGIINLIVRLNSVGTLEDRHTYREALLAYFTPRQGELDPDSRDRLTRNPLRILDSKDPQTQAIAADAPKLLDYLSAESLTHFDQVRSHLTDLGVANELDHTLVRGLDYYTRTAFEIQSSDLGAQSAVCGGGRYDRLLEQLGGSPTPAVGWAMGMERLVLLLESQQGEMPPAVSVYLVSRGGAAEAQALVLAQSLRQHHLSTELDLSGAKFDKQLKRASQSGAQLAVILGDDEVSQGVAQIKHLSDGTQVAVPLPEVVDHISNSVRQRAIAESDNLLTRY
ncbi:MAG: histidine--tRNA ligase [Oscillatoriales cyanobacterium SM2_2_1]|nr:histidine--tRNA ligase [Oscillatoriales cyanobacterium SM2_2_1]